jgi:hypothetical protein
MLLLLMLVVQVSLCVWMLVVALVMCPLCWFGTPNDFW